MVFQRIAEVHRRIFHMMHDVHLTARISETLKTTRGKEKMKEKKSNFSGSIGFVLAAAGSAVGVGNIWR